MLKNRADDLAVFVIGSPNDGGLCYSRVGYEAFFNFEWCNVLVEDIYNEHFTKEAKPKL